MPESDEPQSERVHATSRRTALKLGAAGLAGGALFTVDLLQPSTAAAFTADVTVTLKPGTSGRSQLQLGLVDADQNLMYGDPEAVHRATDLIGGSLYYDNIQIMAWGADDPWPDRSGPIDFSSIDRKMQVARQAGITPAITFCEAPWWMKGVLEADGSTTPLAAADEWGSKAYNSRVLDDHMDAWVTLVAAVAERYLQRPYNVRHFMVWNELKGYWNPIANRWDADDSVGDPSGPNAKHGYTHLYNLTRTALQSAAVKVGIDPIAIQVGGPYVPLTLRPLPGSSEVTGDYGYLDQSGLDAIRTWCRTQNGAEFFVIDGWNIYWTSDGIVYPPVGPFAANQVFADVVAWIRSLPFRSAQKLPIWFAEWYAIGSDNSDAANNAIKASAAVHYLKAGGAVALNWTGTGDGTPAGGLWSSTAEAGGGYPTPWWHSTKLLRDHFAPGTRLINAESSSTDVEVVASRTKVLLVNTTDRTRVVQIEGRTAALSPYQVAAIDTP